VDRRRLKARTSGRTWVCHRTNKTAPIWDIETEHRTEKNMSTTPTCTESDLAHADSPNDFFIIDAHLKKARASSEKASRLDQRGQHREAIVQNKLTRIFIHNALARLNRQCEAHHY
jgi:hypothetical protein